MKFLGNPWLMIILKVSRKHIQVFLFNKIAVPATLLKKDFDTGVFGSILRDF